MTTVWMFTSAAAERLALRASAEFPAEVLGDADKRAAGLLSHVAELLRGNEAHDGLLRDVEMPEGLDEPLGGDSESADVALELLGVAAAFSRAVRWP